MKTESQIVAIGGGHGLGRVLSALNYHQENLTGIATTTDNGGSTGRIRASQGGIAWGDMRNCINQLITQPSVGSMMFEYRFRGDGELAGHNLGNLMLTALANLSIRPLDAINLIRDMLQVPSSILPMSEHPADLVAQMQGGEIISGETNIDELTEVPARLMLEPVVHATNEAIEAIKNAQLILLGPGSFLTSVMPPLLLPELADALNHTTAKIVFIRNLDKEKGPAGEMSMQTMLNWCERAMHGRKINYLLGANYLDEITDIKQIVVEDLASPNYQWRHDRKKLAESIEHILVGSV